MQDSMSIHFGSCTWPIHKPNLRQLVHNSHIFGWIKLSHCQHLPATKSRQVLDEEVGGLGDRRWNVYQSLTPPKNRKSPPYGSAEWIDPILNNTGVVIQESSNSTGKIRLVRLQWHHEKKKPPRCISLLGLASDRHGWCYLHVKLTFACF